MRKFLFTCLILLAAVAATLLGQLTATRDIDFRIRQYVSDGLELPLSYAVSEGWVGATNITGSAMGGVLATPDSVGRYTGRKSRLWDIRVQSFKSDSSWMYVRVGETGEMYSGQFYDDSLRYKVTDKWSATANFIPGIDTVLVNSGAAVGDRFQIGYFTYEEELKAYSPLRQIIAAVPDSAAGTDTLFTKAVSGRHPYKILFIKVVSGDVGDSYNLGYQVKSLEDGEWTGDAENAKSVFEVVTITASNLARSISVSTIGPVDSVRFSFYSADTIAFQDLGIIEGN